MPACSDRDAEFVKGGERLSLSADERQDKDGDFLTYLNKQNTKHQADKVLSIELMYQV